MQTRLNAYLNFRGSARTAMQFYQTVFGGKLTMQTYKDFHASQDPAEDDLIMHAMLEADNGISFMASDVPPRMDYTPGTNFGMALSGDDAAELTAYFEKLSAGGTVVMPLAAAPWGDTFGECLDRYGVSWLVDIAAAKV